jgi:hypothetical protein
MATNSKTLRDALAHYYDSRGARIVADDAGLSLARIDLSGDAQSVWFSILREANNTSRLDALVARAHQDYPGEPAFRDDAAGPSPTAAPRGIESASPSKSAFKVSGPVPMFVSYAREDEELKNRLMLFLKPMQRERLIGVWHDRNIDAGAEIRGAIDENFKQARVVLLLVSQAFLASDFIYDHEMTRALERHDRGEARVVPIILRPCSWTNTPFAKLQALPRDAKPVTQWPDRDEAFLSIEQGLRKLVESLRA